MARFGSKQPYEEYYVAFDFEALIGVASVASEAVIVYDSTGATVTSTITVVANQVIDSPLVNVWVQGGVTDNEYKITCRATTDASPQERYELDADLPVAEV